MQFAQSSIAQLEKTRSSQQTQITTLQTQVQSLELTIQNLGRFVAHVAECNIDLELPGEVRRILQQLDDLERQHRKPLFTERKIGKSVSVNSHLGFPLKVLEELNEKEEHGSPQKQKKEKTPFFEHTYEQLRQQQQRASQGSLSGGIVGGKAGAGGSVTSSQQSQQTIAAPPTLQQQTQQHLQRPNRLLDTNSNATTHNVTEIRAKLDELKLPEHVDKYVANIKSPLEVDSGVGTPLSPPSTSSNTSSSYGDTSNSTSGGTIFSRMGYKTTPAALSPIAVRHNYATIPTAVTVAPPTTVDMINSTATTRTIKTTKSSLLSSSSSASTVVSNVDIKIEEMHPLSMVGGDVNVRFNGTTKLKSIKPVHHMRSLTTSNAANVSSENEPAANVSSRS